RSGSRRALPALLRRTSTASGRRGGRRLAARSGSRRRVARRKRPAKSDRSGDSSLPTLRPGHAPPRRSPAADRRPRIGAREARAAPRRPEERFPRARRCLTTAPGPGGRRERVRSLRLTGRERSGRSSHRRRSGLRLRRQSRRPGRPEHWWRSHPLAHKLDRKELKKPDEFQVVAGKTMEWLVAHRGPVVGAVIAIAVVAAATWGFTTWSGSRENKAGAALAQALELDQRPIAAEGNPQAG